MLEFRKAKRQEAKLRIAVTGPSGSGKTYSAILLASGLGKKIALIDTENASAANYSNIIPQGFDTLNIDAPYTVAKYVEAIEAAEKAGYDVLIIDSITHEWAGEGGLLDKKTAIDQRGGNSFTNWATITREHDRFKSRLLSCRSHLITTLRSKQDYVVEQNDKGKALPKKVGLAPIQREGMEYEFTLVFDIAQDNHAVASKDRTGLFHDRIFKITPAIGEELGKWLGSAEPISLGDAITTNMKAIEIIPSRDEIAAVIDRVISNGNDKELPAYTKTFPVTEPQIKRMFAIAHHAKWPNDKVKHFIKENFNIESSKELSREQYDLVCKTIESQPLQ